MRRICHMSRVQSPVWERASQIFFAKMSTVNTLVCYELHPPSNPLNTSPNIIRMIDGWIKIKELPIRTPSLNVVIQNTQFFVHLSTSDYVQVLLERNTTRILWPFMEAECYAADVIKAVKCAQHRKHGREVSDNEAYMFYDLMYYRMKSNHFKLQLNAAFLESRQRYEKSMDDAIARVAEATVSRAKWVNTLLEDCWVKYSQN